VNVTLSEFILIYLLQQYIDIQIHNNVSIRFFVCYTDTILYILETIVPRQNSSMLFLYIPFVTLIEYYTYTY
jgi:hypothetical protein